MDLSLQNYIVIGVTAALTVALLLLFHWMIPRWLGRLIRRVDDVIPAELSSLVTPVARLIRVLLALLLLIPAGFTIASQLGVDVSGVLNFSEAEGAAVGRWLAARFLVIVIIVAVAFLGIRIISRVTTPLIAQYLTKRGDADEDPDEVEKRARTLQGVVSNTLNVVVAAMAFFMILAQLGINITPILAGAGVVGIAVGLGAQSLIKDIIAGVLIMLEDQYRVGDVATIAGVSGMVEDINLRRTTLRDWDYTQHVVPNGEIRIASNFTKERSGVNLNIEVAYKEDLDRVMAVIAKVGQDLSDDRRFGPLITSPLRPMRVHEFGGSGIAIKVMGETKPMQQWDVAGEFRRRIKRVFDEEGIEIPFPHVTLYWGADAEPSPPRPPDAIKKDHGQRDYGQPPGGEGPSFGDGPDGPDGP